MEVALEAGAEDVITDDDGSVEVLSAPRAISKPSKCAWKAQGCRPSWLK